MCVCVRFHGGAEDLQSGVSPASSGGEEVGEGQDKKDEQY